MPFKRIDKTLVHGEHLYFEDKGKVSLGSKTRKFAVTSRYNHAMLGYVKWFSQWRQYVFFPLNCILNHACLREMSEFCVESTTAHREKRQSFPAPEPEPVVEAGT